MRAFQYVAPLLLLCVTFHEARADLAVWEYTGVIPDDALFEGIFADLELVKPGESWRTLVGVDMPAEDILPDDQTRGEFPETCLWADVRFSGGYSLYVEPANNKDSELSSVKTYDDFYFENDDVFLDGVVVDVWQDWGGEELARFTAGVITYDVTLLSSDALPPHPTDGVGDFTAAGTGFGLAVGEISIEGYGRLSYAPDPELPIRFRTIPEPSIIAMWLVFGLIGGIAAWFRRKV